MDKEKAIKILRSARSSKEQLREALAWTLGEAPQPSRNKFETGSKGGANEPSVFNECKSVFSAEYRKTAGVPYVFGAKDGVALASIIKKLEAMGESNIPGAFTVIVQNLPEWYRKNAFSIPVINSKFNEIIASISKKTGSTNGNNAAREAVRNAFSGGR